MIKIVNRSKGFGAKRNERVSRKQMVSEGLLIDWKDVTKENQDEVYWDEISFNQKPSEDFIRDFHDKVNWSLLSRARDLSVPLIREFQDKVDWEELSINQELSEDFIREFQDKVDWKRISRHQRFSEDFIREFQDKVDWKFISIYQYLSEDFIRELQDKVNLPLASWHQDLSDDFRKEIGHALKTGDPLAAKSDERNERIARLKKIVARKQDEKASLVRNSKKDETADKKKMQRTEKVAPKKSMSLKERLEMHRRATKKISERKSAIRFGRRYEADTVDADTSIAELVDAWMDLFEVENKKKATKEVEKLLQEFDESAVEVLEWLKDEDTVSIVNLALKGSLVNDNVEFAKGLKEGDIIVYHGSGDQELAGEIIEWDPSNLSKAVRENLFDWEFFARDLMWGGDVSFVWMNDDFEEVDPDTEGAEEWLVWANDDDLESARIVEASSTRERDIENLAEHLEANWTLDMIDKKDFDFYFDYVKLLNHYLIHDGYHRVSYDTVIYLP